MEFDPSVEELASWLLSEIDSPKDTRQRILCEQEILRKCTDVEHGLTVKQIREMLQLRTSASADQPSEPTVLDDLHALTASPLPDFPIATPARGKNHGFRNEKAFLTEGQVRVLINLVESCRFITKEESTELCETLNSFLSFYQEQKLFHEVHVERRLNHPGQDVFSAIDTISEAIHLGKQISFNYVFYDLKGEQQILLGKRLTETPLNLLYDFGQYYVETWDANPEHPCLRNRRLDRVRDAKIEDIPAETSEEITQIKNSVGKRLHETFDMLGGDRADLFLYVPRRLSNLIYNRFGHEIKFEHETKDENGEVLGAFIRVTVQLSPTFYRWLFGFKGEVKLVRPISYSWATSGSWSKYKIKDNRTADEKVEPLRKDYEKACKGFLQHLEAVSNSLGKTLCDL